MKYLLIIILVGFSLNGFGQKEKNFPYEDVILVNNKVPLNSNFRLQFMLSVEHDYYDERFEVESGEIFVNDSTYSIKDSILKKEWFTDSKSGDKFAVICNLKRLKSGTLFLKQSVITLYERD
jgi:hypothetical protein